jgi:hypothetical protein
MAYKASRKSLQRVGSIEALVADQRSRRGVRRDWLPGLLLASLAAAQVRQIGRHVGFLLFVGKLAELNFELSGQPLRRVCHATKGHPGLN